MNVVVNVRFGLEIEGIGALPFGTRADQMLALLGSPDSVFDGRHEFRDLGCFVDVRSDVVDAVEFWNNGAANPTSVLLYGTEVLREPAASVKEFLQTLNIAAAVDSWFVNLDVFVSGGNPRYAQEAIAEANADGTFHEKENVLLEELEKATRLTSFGFGRYRYCADGLAQLARLS